MRPTLAPSKLALRLLLAIGLLFGLLPSVAVAAPATPTIAQEEPAADAPQVFVSDLLPAASGPGRLYTLTLLPDATATLSANFLNGEEPIVEIGSWAADETGALLVSLMGTAELDYEAPVEFTFTQAEDGSLTATAWDETRFGSEGLALAPAQNLAFAGNYASGTLPAASSPGRELTLALAADGTASLTSDYLNDEAPIVELGTWSADADAGEVSVSLTGRPDAVYEAPTEFTFAVGEDGGLTATVWDETLFGSEGLSLAPAAAAVAPADGVWVSNILPAASSPGQVVLLILYPDGTLQSSTWYLNNELPIIENGAWIGNDDGTVTVTITGSTEREYETAQELIFEYDGETLTYLSLVLSRLQEEGLSGDAEAVAFYTTDVLPAASSPGLQRSLIFYDDGSVQMVSDYLNGEEPIIELGSWVENEDGSLSVELTGTEDTEYEAPVALTFALADGTLTATEWDTTRFGSEGLSFTEQDVEDLLLEDEEPVSSAPVEGADTPAAAATPVLTTTEAVTPAEAVTPTETVSVTVPEGEPATGTDDPLAAAAPFEAPAGAQAVFTSGLLPAASSPGRLLRLVLFEDGSNQMISDYLNGEAPILEVGTWEESAAGELVVTLTGQIASPYSEPVVITFAQNDGALTAVEWDESRYGSEPLSLTLETGD